MSPLILMLLDYALHLDLIWRCKDTNYFSFHQIFPQLFSPFPKHLTFPPVPFNISLHFVLKHFLHSSSTVPPLFLHSFTIKPLDLHWSHTGLTLEQHCSYSYPTFVLRQMPMRYSVTALQWNPRPIKIWKYKLFVYIYKYIYTNKIIFQKIHPWKITVTL